MAFAHYMISPPPPYGGPAIPPSTATPLDLSGVSGTIVGHVCAVLTFLLKPQPAARVLLIASSQFPRPAQPLRRRTTTRRDAGGPGGAARRIWRAPGHTQISRGTISPMMHSTLLWGMLTRRQVTRRYRSRQSTMPVHACLVTRVMSDSPGSTLQD